jgi:hypothetical protein
MRTALLGVAVLVLAAPAGADLRLYFSPVSGTAGLANDAYALLPTAGQHMDYQDAAGQPGPYYGVTFPDAVNNPWSNPTVGIGEPVYMWLKINEGPEWNGYKIENLALDIKVVSGVEPALHDAAYPDARIQDLAYYQVDSTGVPNGHQRWVGAGQPNWLQTDRITLNAVTAYGILNSVMHDPSNLWQAGPSTGAYSRVALLGAVSFSAPGEYYLEYDNTQTPIIIEGHPEITGWTVPLISGRVIVTPEPGTLGLLAVAALLCARRR